MSDVIVILLSVWLAINFVVAPGIGLLVTRRRRTDEQSTPVEPPAFSADAYVSILLSRLVIQACRVLGVEQTSLLVRNSAGGRDFIVVAAHGMGEDLIGRRVAVDDALASSLSTGDPLRGDLGRILPEAGAGTGIALSATTPSGRDVVLCTPENRMRPLERGELRLLGELAWLCAAAVEHMGPSGRPESAVRACATALAAVGESRNRVLRRSPLDLTGFAARVGDRLGLDPGALVELQLATCVYETATTGMPSAAAFTTRNEHREPALQAAPTETADRLTRVPGFEVIALIVRFIGERWDGQGHPHLLRGDRIPLASRILAACSFMCALTTSPPHGPGTPIESALRDVQAASGTAFDPTVVMAVSHELMGDVPMVGEVAPAADWARADALYSVVS